MAYGLWRIAGGPWGYWPYAIRHTLPEAYGVRLRRRKNVGAFDPTVGCRSAALIVPRRRPDSSYKE
jgi:hypothetical protein